jgi:hypothetical protein
MLEEAVDWHGKQVSLGQYRGRFLIVDADRAGRDGEWTLDELRQEATQERFIVIAQHPKHEGLLYRMTPGKERESLSASEAMSKLQRVWPTYQKPATAGELRRRYSLDDLRRVATVDQGLSTLLRRIGLIR